MDTVQVRFFKLCIIVTLLRVYLVIPGLMTLTLLPGHRFIRIPPPKKKKEKKKKENANSFLDSCPP